MNYRRANGGSGVFDGFANAEAREAADRDVLAGLRGRFSDQLSHGDVGVANGRLLQKDELGIEAVQFSVDPLV